MDEFAFREGDLLAGKYRFERVLGRGGMGVVVAAFHVQLAQPVAMKFLLREACAHPEAVSRFLREARAAVRIQSEHVARVLDVGELEPGVPYIVMEYLRGSDLGEVVSASGALQVSDAVDYVLQACEAIAEAHALGIVHRDLKPANLFLTRRPDGSGFVKVIDFGISKATQEGGGLGESANMTSTTAMLGSPRYMSPEQIRSTKNVDHRTDIWALGVVLFEILTARPVYLAETLSGLIAMIGADPPPLLRSVRSHAPVALERVIARCLEKDPARRFAHVGELAMALAQIGDQRAKASAERTVGILRAAGLLDAPAGARTWPAPGAGGGSAPVDPSSGAGTGAAWGGTGQGRSRKVMGTVALVATGVLASSAVVFAVVLHGNRGPGTAPPPSLSAPPLPPSPPPKDERVVAKPGPTETPPPPEETHPVPDPPLPPPTATALPRSPAERKPVAGPTMAAGGDAGALRATTTGQASPHHGPAVPDRGADPF